MLRAMPFAALVIMLRAMIKLAWGLSSVLTSPPIGALSVSHISLPEIPAVTIPALIRSMIPARSCTLLDDGRYRCTPTISVSAAGVVAPVVVLMKVVNHVSAAWLAVADQSVMGGLIICAVGSTALIAALARRIMSASVANVPEK